MNKKYLLIVIGSSGIVLTGILMVFYVTYANSFQNSSLEEITPGSHPSVSCPASSDVPLSGLILNASEFKIYNLSGISDYIISPGNQGDITYQINRGNAHTNMQNHTIQMTKEVHITNDVVFYHEEEDTIHQKITTYNHTKNDGTTYHTYKACYPSYGGNLCTYSNDVPPKTITVPMIKTDHSGIRYTLNPHDIVLPFNSSTIIKATIYVDSNAMKGTYWFTFVPGPCFGPLLSLITVGDKPYHISELNHS